MAELVYQYRDATRAEGMTDKAQRILDASLAAAADAGLERLAVVAAKGGGHKSHGHGTEWDLVGYNPDGTLWNHEQRAIVAQGGRGAGANRFGLYEMGRGLGQGTLHIGYSGTGRPAAVWGANGLTNGDDARKFNNPVDRAFLQSYNRGAAYEYSPIALGSVSGFPASQNAWVSAAGATNQSGLSRNTVKNIQRAMNVGGYTGATGEPLRVDGVMGDNTKTALQKALVDAANVTPNSPPEQVRAAQAVLRAAGVTDTAGRPIAIDGKFGNSTKQAMAKASAGARGQNWAAGLTDIAGDIFKTGVDTAVQLATGVPANAGQTPYALYRPNTLDAARRLERQGGIPAQTPAIQRVNATISERSPKSEIQQLQRDLIAAGSDPGSVDGVYGRQTTGAVREFQRRSGLNPDGEAGPNTLTRLAQVNSQRTPQPRPAQPQDRVAASTEAPFYPRPRPSSPETGPGTSARLLERSGILPPLGLGAASAGQRTPRPRPQQGTTIAGRSETPGALPAQRGGTTVAGFPEDGRRAGALPPEPLRSVFAPRPAPGGPGGMPVAPYSLNIPERERPGGLPASPFETGPYGPGGDVSVHPASRISMADAYPGTQVTPELNRRLMESIGNVARGGEPLPPTRTTAQAQNAQYARGIDQYRPNTASSPRQQPSGQSPLGAAIEALFNDLTGGPAEAAPMNYAPDPSVAGEAAWSALAQPQYSFGNTPVGSLRPQGVQLSSAERAALGTTANTSPARAFPTNLQMGGVPASPSLPAGATQGPATRTSSAVMAPPGWNMGQTAPMEPRPVTTTTITSPQTAAQALNSKYAAGMSQYRPMTAPPPLPTVATPSPTMPTVTPEEPSLWDKTWSTIGQGANAAGAGIGKGLEASKEAAQIITSPLMQMLAQGGAVQHAMNAPQGQQWNRFNSNPVASGYGPNVARMSYQMARQAEEERRRRQQQQNMVAGNSYGGNARTPSGVSYPTRDAFGNAYGTSAYGTGVRGY